MTGGAERRLLLVYPPPTTPIGIVTSESVRLPPMGLAYLAAAARRAGYEPTILDMRVGRNTRAAFMETFQRVQPKLVGFSVMTDFVSNALRLARLVKSISPPCCVVFGGPHPPYRLDEVLNTGVVDIVAMRGDGEQVLVEIADAVWSQYDALAAFGLRDAAWEAIRGVAFKRAGSIIVTPPRPRIENLDMIPWPAWDLLSLKDYHVPLVHTARGCVGHCKFCCEGGGAENRVRFRSVPHVMEEVCYLYGLGVRRISFSDDNFVTGRKRLEELCTAIRGACPGLKWTCATRVDSITAESIRYMADAGCDALHFGVESTARKTHDALGKGFKLDQLTEKVAAARALNIHTVLTFVLGLPTESEEDVRESLAYGMQLKKEYGAMFAFAILTPYPGSEYGDHPERHGIVIESGAYDSYNTLTAVIRTPHFTRRRLQTLQCDFVLEQAKTETPSGKDTLRLVERGLVDARGRITVIPEHAQFAAFYRETAKRTPAPAPDGEASQVRP